HSLLRRMSPPEIHMPRQPSQVSAENRTRQSANWEAAATAGIDEVDGAPKGYAKLPPCLVGMDACGSAHYWAREITQLGHTVKLMTPKYVKPYVKRGKNDAIDAAAICEAVARPSMSFVPVKGLEQQGLSKLRSARPQLSYARRGNARCDRTG